LETALELIERAIQLNDVDQHGAYYVKADVLAKMVRHSEALEAFLMYEELVHKTNMLHTLDFKEGLFLYHVGEYSKAEKRLAEEMLYIEENVPDGVNRNGMLATATFYLLLVEYELGDEELVEYM